MKLSLGIAELAVVVYDALDWELSFERKLSSDLEEVIDLMTSADDMEQHDEGISIGDDDMNTDLCQKIFGYCCKHLNMVSSKKYKNKNYWVVRNARLALSKNT